MSKKPKLPKLKTARECLDHFLPIAMELPESQRTLFRGNAAIVRANVRYALDQHGLDDARVQEVFRDVTLAQFDELPLIARALHLAVTLMPSITMSDGAVQETLSKLAPLREDGLSELRALARRGLITSEEIASIEAGKGTTDMAEDAVAIATLLRQVRKKNKRLQQRILDDDEIESLEGYGNWLLDNLTPSGGRRPRKAASEQSVQRNAIAALLRERYQVLRGIAYVFHGDAFDQFVPPLLSSLYVKPEDAPAKPDDDPPKP